MILKEFVDKFPQREDDGKLNYVVFGGAAVRCLEEDYKRSTGRYIKQPLRVLSDIDVLVLNECKRYPVHSTSIKNIFSVGFSPSLEDLIQNLISVNIEGTDIVVPNRNLLVTSKSVSVQAQNRFKDYEDSVLVSRMGLNPDVLAGLYENVPKLKGAGFIMVDKVFDSFKYASSEESLGYKFFACATPFTYLLKNVPESQRVEVDKKITSFLIKNNKDAYENMQVLSIFGGLITEIPEAVRMKSIPALLDNANGDYHELDMLVNYRIMPALQFPEKESDKIKVLYDLGIIGRPVRRHSTNRGCIK